MYQRKTTGGEDSRSKKVIGARIMVKDRWEIETFESRRNPLKRRALVKERRSSRRSRTRVRTVFSVEQAFLRRPCCSLLTPWNPRVSTGGTETSASRGNDQATTKQRPRFSRNVNWFQGTTGNSWFAASIKPQARCLPPLDSAFFGPLIAHSNRSS